MRLKKECFGMKSSIYRKTLRTVIGLMAGTSLLGVGNCTSNEVKVQFSNGLRTALTGVFNIGSADLSNQVFDVDD